MKIGVASGKGGTGKTTFVANLALSLDQEIQLFDLDVEEPNLNEFLDIDLDTKKEVYQKAPKIETKKCTYCGKCAEKCEFNALSVLNEEILFFNDLCHGCGLCKKVCPENAIKEKDSKIGLLEKGKKENIEFFQGTLEIGEALATPLITELKNIKNNRLSLYDIPPGTGCPVIEAMEDLDYCILITEPTPFGFQDLKLSIEVAESLNVPYGVVINKYGVGDKEIEKYCKKRDIEVLLKIPNKRKIAELYSVGTPFVEEVPKWKEKFKKVFQEVIN